MDQVETNNKNSKFKYIKYGLLILICGILILTALLTLYYLNKKGYIYDFLEWIGEIGYYGNLVMILCIVIVNVPFMIGYGSLMFASGFLFKFKVGLITIVIGCQIGVLLIGLLIRFKYFRELSENVFFFF